MGLLPCGLTVTLGGTGQALLSFAQAASHTSVLFLSSDASPLGRGMVRILSTHRLSASVSSARPLMHSRPPYHSLRKPFPTQSSHDIGHPRVQPIPLFWLKSLFGPIWTAGLFENALPSSTEETDKQTGTLQAGPGECTLQRQPCFGKQAPCWDEGPSPNLGA